jgi:hypothetical protein
MAQTKTRKTSAGRTNTAADKRTAPTVGKNTKTELDVTLPKQVINWFRAAPHERYPLAAMAGVYGGGTALNAIHASHEGIGAAALVSVCGIIASSRKIKDGARAFKTCALAAGTGIWVTIAGVTGTIGTDAPHIAMTAGYGVLAGTAYVMYRRDDVTRSRINRRKQREAWPEFAHKVGIGGSFVDSREDTRLGERIVVDTRGTGKRASTIAASNDLAERVAEYYGLPISRVNVTLGKRAGLIVINIRRRDPWANPIAHPRLDPNPEITIPDVGKVDIVAGPAIVGQEPETGRPLHLTLADEDGARRIMVIATPGSGKTVLFNDLLEWVTASPHGIAWGADLTKAKEMRLWRDAGALDLAACGPKDTAKAALMLQLAKKTIEYRAEANQEKTFVPGPGRPYIFLFLDEIDGLVSGNSTVAQAARENLKFVTSKGRSEGVGVILAGQRGTAAWLGGADIRNIIDTIVLGTVARPGEVNMAIGNVDLNLPDMTKYGEGRKGVIVIKELFGGVESGRTFRLDDFDDIRRIAAGRTPTSLEPGLLEHLGDAYLQAKGPLAAFMHGKAQYEAATGRPLESAETVARLDAEVEASMPEDLREQWAARQAKLDGIRKYAEQMPTVEHDPRVEDIVAERRRQFTEQAKTAVPDDAKEIILRLAADGGVVNEDIQEALDKSPATVRRYLVALCLLGLIERRGRTKGARYYLVAGAGADDAREESDDDGE